MFPTLTTLIPLLFLGLVAGAVLAAKLPFMVLALYLGLSALAYLAYARDKSAARRRQWRIPERSLHLVALCGGWPGAMLAQRRLRHKTRKTGFQVVFRMTAALNCAALGWLLTPAGSAVLRGIPAF